MNREYLEARSPKKSSPTSSACWKSSPISTSASLLHEDWESYGFYLYEQHPDGRPSLAEPMIEAVSKVCPVDPSDIIEDRPAKNGIIRPNIDIRSRPLWAEAFFLIAYKTRMSYTLEAPSDYPLSTRVDGLVAAVRAGVDGITHA